MMQATLSDTKRKLLDALLRGEATETLAVHRGIERRSAGEPSRLGLAQEQIWRRSVRAADAPPLYNETITVYRDGPLDVAILQRCFDEILRRHEAWRTVFKTIDGVPVQSIDPTLRAPKIPLMDLRKLPVGRRGQEAMHLLSELATQRFELERGPLLRALLLRMDDQHYRFAIVAHQSILDGVSTYQVLPTELAALYDAFSVGKASPLPELKLQYADFTRWQREWLEGESLEKQKAFWRRKLAPPLPALRWPKERSPVAGEKYRGVIRSFEVPVALSTAIRALTQREQVTLFTTLLAGFTALLHHYTGENDILVATLSPSGRKRSETQKLLGYFLNPVALRFDLSSAPTFRELLMQARLVIAEAISHDDVPLEQIAEELNIDTGRDPFVKIAMSLQPQVPPLGSWNVTSMDAQNGGSAWDLYLAFIERAHGLIGRVQFNPDVFSEDTVVAALNDLWRLLKEATSDASRRVTNLLPSEA